MIVLLFISIISSGINGKTAGTFDAALNHLCSIHDLGQELFVQYKSNYTPIRKKEPEKKVSSTQSFSQFTYSSQSDHVTTSTMSSIAKILSTTITINTLSMGGIMDDIIYSNDYNKNSKEEGITVDDNIFTAQSNAKFDGSNLSIWAKRFYKCMNDVFIRSTNKYMKCIQECMELLCIIIVIIRYLKSQSATPFLYIIMCSWIILGCNASACTCAKCADLDPRKQTVWNGTPVNTHDISNYTCGQIKYITSFGGDGDVICSNSANTITFQTPNHILVLLGGGPIGNYACCSLSDPRRICNAPDKQSDINELCKNLGYSSGTFTQTIGYCPEVHFAGGTWTSDFVTSSGAITHFECTGCVDPEPPEECVDPDATPCPTNGPTTAPSIPTLAPTTAPSASTLAPSASTLAPTQPPSKVPSIAPSVSPSPPSNAPTKPPSTDSSELIYSKENTHSSEEQSNIKDSIQHTSEAPQNSNQRSSDQNSDRNLLSVRLNNNPTRTKAYSESVVSGKESLKQAEMLHFTQQQSNENKSTSSK